MAHIHKGKRGVAGNVLIPLCGPCTSGQTGQMKISKDAADLLESGRTYVNVHTAKNAAGEIRGQVNLVGEDGGGSGGSTGSQTTSPAVTDPMPDPGYTPPPATDPTEQPPLRERHPGTETTPSRSRITSLSLRCAAAAFGIYSWSRARYYGHERQPLQ